MNQIDEITKRERDWYVRGWLYDSGKVVARCRYEENGDRLTLPGYGKPSPDLIDSFGEPAAHSRFEFSIPVTKPVGLLVFEFECGASTVIPLSNHLDAVEPIVVNTHQIENGRYYGEFELPEPIKVRKVVLSPGSPDGVDAITIAARDFKPIPYRKFGSENLDFITNRVNIDSPMDPTWSVDRLNVYFYMEDGSIRTLTDIGNRSRENMDSYLIPQKFFQWIVDHPEPLSVLELGSRARSGVSRRKRIPARHRYLGLDLLPGENVDIVGDAHRLSELVEPHSVDAVFGISVFEHLAMPWKVALELNRVLRRGGRALFFTHQAWPLHDSPFDFWRFSKDTWMAIFNKSTGFKIVEAAIGDKGRLHPEIQVDANQFLSDTYCYLVSTVLIEKIGETQLTWDVPLEEVYEGFYPE